MMRLVRMGGMNLRMGRRPARFAHRCVIPDGCLERCGKADCQLTIATAIYRIIRDLTARSACESLCRWAGIASERACHAHNADRTTGCRNEVRFDPANPGAQSERSRRVACGGTSA